jgi:hypothetical protein
MIGRMAEQNGAQEQERGPRNDACGRILVHLLTTGVSIQTGSSAAPAVLQRDHKS